MNSREAEVERLFLDALERPSSLRERWVLSREDVARDLRDEAIALLRADRALGEPAEETPPSRDRAGPYELVRELGRGAGGTVWLARRLEPPERTVAIKITDSREPEILTRFRGEASALARLEHPGIATILEFGELGDGRAWFAMSLVAGEPIVRHAEANRLTTEERVRLVARACAAVTHAHRRGILHRDLKPSNILVDIRTSPPRPVVIDLGLAKVLEGDPLSEAERTLPGRVVGTPEYMAPEQALGTAPDVRMDVFSLGCVLAATVTGEPPRSREALRETGLPLFAAIARVAPARPSRSRAAEADRSCSWARWRDLDAIVLKAIEIDPENRYGSVDAIEEDLERWLAGGIPDAARPHPVRRATAWVRRRRGWAAAATLAAVGAVGATVAVLDAAADAARERRDADTLLTMVESMLIAADPWYVRGTRSPVIEQGLSQSQALLAERNLGDNPRVALLRARCLLVAGDDKQAIAAAARTIELTDGRDPAIVAEAMLVEAYARDHRRDDQSRAYALADGAVELARTVLSPDDRRMLEIELARGRIVTRRQPLDGIALLGEALVRARAAFGEDDPLAIRIEQAELRALGFTGETVRSVPLHRALLERSRRVLGPAHPITIAVAAGLMNSLAYANDWAGVIGTYREVMPLLEEAVGPNASMRLGMMNTAGFALTSAGSHAEAISLLDECVERYRALHDPVHPLTVLAERNLMTALAAAGRLEEAIARIEELCTHPVDERQPTRLEIDRGNLEMLRRRLAETRASR